MNENRFPSGWDEDRVRRVLEHHESQSEDEASAEDGAAEEPRTWSLVAVPVDLVRTVRELLARHKRSP